MPQIVPAPPNAWAGSKPEWNIFWALQQIGLKPDIDFIYQSPQLGGRIVLGGVVLDFFVEKTMTAIEVQSTHYHYTSTAVISNDALQRAQLLSYGIQVIYIDEEDALRNPIYYTKEALAGVDHSLIGR